VVTDELTKKTGVKWKSIEGLNGVDYNQRLNLAISSGEFPDVFQIAGPDAAKLEKAGLIWPLKMEDLNKYAPEITSRFSDNDKATMLSSDNTIMGFPSGMTTSEVDKKINPNYQAAIGDWASAACDYVILSARDDILNKIFPGTKTINDLYNIYKDKKTLTYNDVKIPGLETADEFITYLRDVKALNLKQDGKPVMPFALGGENMFLYEMGVPGMGMMEGFEGGTYCTAAWNPNDSQYELFYSLPGYKAMLKKWNGVAREGLIDPNSVIMKKDQLIEKVKSGIYAVVDNIDFNLKDMNAACDVYKRGYHYRPVYIPVKKTQYNPGFWPCGAGPSTYYVLNKKTIKESDLPKIMNFFNFFLTKEGSELVTWGPESAGLWTVGSDGKRQFKDAELQEDAINWSNKPGTKTCAYYGLVEGNWGGATNMDWRYYCYYNTSVSPYCPRAQAWPLPKTGSIDEFYGSGTSSLLYNLDSKTVSWETDTFPTIYNMQVANNKDFADANNKFQTVVNDFISTNYPKILFSKTDADFETNYKKGLDAYINDGEFNTLKTMADKLGKDYFAVHTNIKPIPWPK
jgi:ABC-type glycerol-3-phosphate transport system substrate-binding protein